MKDKELKDDKEIKTGNEIENEVVEADDSPPRITFKIEKIKEESEKVSEKKEALSDKKINISGTGTEADISDEIGSKGVFALNGITSDISEELDADDSENMTIETKDSVKVDVEDNGILTLPVSIGKELSSKTDDIENVESICDLNSCVHSEFDDSFDVVGKDLPKALFEEPETVEENPDVLLSLEIDLLALIRKQLTAEVEEEPQETVVHKEPLQTKIPRVKKKRHPVWIYPLAAVIIFCISIGLWHMRKPAVTEPIEEPIQIDEIIKQPEKKEIPVIERKNEIISVTIPRNETYLPLEGKQQLDVIVWSIGDVDTSVTWSSSDTSVADVSEEGMVTGYSNGTVFITAEAKNGMSATTEVTVTDCIIIPTNKYKLFIPSHYYTPEEAILMDKILESRINDAGGEGTRGAVIAAARFLTLEMEYMIPYFYENGRMNPNPGRPMCDGEGRYYHKGLYLSDSKFDTIIKSVAGPAIWGAPLTNYQDAGYFTPGLRYPNGLDCSGFVSWVMINGGIDTGDIGAGDIIGIDKEFAELGERLPLSPELLLSGEIKPGDLIGIDGHIAVIIGLTDTHIWIAESYYRGVNTVCFTINRGIMACEEYDFVIKMGHIYSGEGQYTDTWVTPDHKDYENLP